MIDLDSSLHFIMARLDTQVALNTILKSCPLHSIMARLDTPFAIESIVL